jgi:hypothetical protein
MGWAPWTPESALVSGLVLVTGAAGDGPDPVPLGGLAVLRPVRAFVRTQDHRAEQLRQLGAEVVAGDPCEIADVECRRSASNKRAASTPTASSFLNNDAPVQGPGQGGKPSGMGCRCRRAAARPPASVPPGLPRIPGSFHLHRRGAGYPPGAAERAEVQVQPGRRRWRSAPRPGSTATIVSSPARQARAGSPASLAMRSSTAAGRRQVHGFAVLVESLGMPGMRESGLVVLAGLFRGGGNPGGRRCFSWGFGELYGTVRGCPWNWRHRSPRARTYSGQRPGRQSQEVSFPQVSSHVEVQVGAYCKNRRLSLRWFEPNTCHT